MSNEEANHELPDDYDELDPYEVLGLGEEDKKKLEEKDIKKAYRRKALVCHPDKARTEEQKAEFHTAFQQVALAYSVLGDPERRRRYDVSGSMRDAMSSDVDGEDAAEFFRDLWKSEVTQEMIERDKEEYKSSGEERQDVLKYYNEGKGDFDVVLENVLHSTDDDEQRFRDMVAEAIANGEVKKFKGFVQKVSSKRKAQRARVAEAEAKEAAELSKELGLDEAKRKARTKGGNKKENDEDVLKALIQNRGQKRMASLLENLEDKYGAKESGKKRKRVDMTEGPTDEEFERIQAELEDKRRKNKKSSKSKAKKSKH